MKLSVALILIAQTQAFTMLSSGTKNTAQFATKEQTTPLFIDKTDTQKSVSEYYGSTLQSSGDLKTNACVTAHVPNTAIKDAIGKIHPSVLDKYYGCGFCTPDLLDGMTVLDLGCGSGRDVYIASQLVGPKGRVIGVDMTEEQLATAKEYQSYHAEKFGYDNVEFYHGLIEKLDEIEGLKDGSVDIIISNCVINLCSDKEAVLKNCHRLLREGGELYFSDVYSNRRIPQSLREDQVMWGECLSGALYWNDFHNIAKSCGFKDPRLVEDAPITVNNKKVQKKIESSGYGELKFYSATYRLMKLESLEPACEDYGQAVIYKGTIPGFESGWSLDDHHYMESGKVFPVCGNSYNMLKQTRFASHFEFIGDFSKHYGIFEGCGSSIPYTSDASNVQSSNSGGGGSCCG
jgi:ubiquinone/menaquinone biosynthesis C-methylase UbiE